MFTGVRECCSYGRKNLKSVVEIKVLFYSMNVLQLGTVHLCRSVIRSIETARIFDFEEFPKRDKVRVWINLYMPISICVYFLDYLSLWCVSGHLHVLYWSSWSFQWKFSCCKSSKFLLKYFMSCLCSDTPSAIWLCNFLQCYLLVYILCCWCYFQQKIAFLYGCDLRAKMNQDIAFITISIAVVVLSWVGFNL